MFSIPLSPLPACVDGHLASQTFDIISFEEDEEDTEEADLYLQKEADHEIADDLELDVDNEEEEEEEEGEEEEEYDDNDEEDYDEEEEEEIEFDTVQERSQEQMQHAIKEAMVAMETIEMSNGTIDVFVETGLSLDSYICFTFNAHDCMLVLSMLYLMLT